MMLDNMDEYDFTPSTNTTLASLFNTTMQPPQDASLTYQAPKQPKLRAEEPKSEQSKSDSKVFCAISVNLWKLESQQYVLLGQHMLAVIGSETQKIYEIIMYRDKKQVVVRAKVGGLNVTHQDDNFATFYDEINQNWLIRFNNDQDCAALSEQVEKYGGKNDKKPTNTERKSSEKGQSEPQTEDSTKAEILSRIAKMGQAMIPSFSKTHAEIEDGTNSGPEPCSSKSPKVSESTTKVNDVRLVEKSAKSTEIVKFPESQQFCCDPLNMFLAENRAQNSEIRLNMSQISAKLDQILSTSESAPQDEALKSKIKALELRTENLLTDLKNYELKCLKLEDKLERQESNGKLDEQSKIQLGVCEKNQEALKEEMRNLSEVVEKQKAELEHYRTIIGENEKKLNENEKEQKDNCNKEKSDFVAQLKQSMNWMFNNIVSSFEEDKQYSSSNVQNIIAPHIKLTTFKIIQEFQQSFKNDAE